MPRRKSDLNKYEKAFIRSQQRKKRKAKKMARKKPNFWTFLFGLFETTPQAKKKITTVKSIKTKTKKSSKRGETFKKILFVFASLITLLFIVIGFWFISLEIPDVSNFEQRKISNSTKIYDRTGEILLYDIHENIQRTVVKSDDINQYAKDAIVAIEDHTFYEHNGVVIKSTLRAIIQTISSRLGFHDEGTSGGSTLTQQVVKNTLLNSQKKISRKVKEWVLAYKIEQRLSKDEILEIYLNEAPYGGTIYGIEKASRTFFGIPASDLSLGQSAYLAAIPNLPTFYSPYGPNKEKLDERQKIVLAEMKRYGYINDQEYREALQEEVEFLSQDENSVKALHFVQYVRAYLEEQYGQDLVENGGLKVITTLDYKLQKIAEDILKEHIQEVEELYNASNSALVAIESTTGHILTMVGSRDYFDKDIDGNFNVALAKRQPGSSFKPIAYANAFEQGYLPETVVFDSKTQFNVRCDADDLTSSNGCYSPTNYDNDFKGPLSLRNALAQSRNIPAIKTLYLGGVTETLSLARNLGINSLNNDPNFYGLGLVLGGGEVNLLELTGAYGVFGNDGGFNMPTGIISIEDQDGNILEEYQQKEIQVLSQNSARMISSILSDNVARTPLFGSQSFLYFGERDVAGKTGTTNDNRDAWLVGYTPNFAVGVWTGNNDNSPMKKGSSISGKPWRAYMDEIIREYGVRNSFREYELPEDIDSYPAMVRGQWEGSGSSVVIDSLSGREANSFTPEERRERNVFFDPHNILHYIDKSNPTVGSSLSEDPQYYNWEMSVQNYVQEEFDDRIRDVIPVVDVDLEDEEVFTFSVRGIDNNDVYELSDNERVTVESKDINGDNIQKVDFIVNGLFIDTDNSGNLNTTLRFDEMSNIQYENTLQIIAFDESGRSVSQEFTFYIEDLE